MKIMRCDATPSMTGPTDWFTGRVRIDGLFQAEAPSPLSLGTVTFEPGARTAWHTHPLGQTLVVVAGAGLVQREGEPIEAIRAGDTVWIAPNERHWHGAGATTAMSHIAIQESLDGSAVTWQEHVSDADYVAI